MVWHIIFYSSLLLDMLQVTVSVALSDAPKLLSSPTVIKEPWRPWSSKTDCISGRIHRQPVDYANAKGSGKLTQKNLVYFWIGYSKN